jgi:hypothetical protein
VLVRDKYVSLSYFEVGVIYTGQTAGALLASKYIEPAIRMLGLNGAINIGFFILIASNFALWVFVLIIVNSSDFATCVFCTRLASGIGSGLINSACLISRANKRSFEEHENPDSFRNQNN